jgi:hypothetical protein
MIKWIKPNKSEIETNDAKATIEKAESLGWKRAEKKRPRKIKPESLS